jgi:hypothetical protein
MEQGSHDLNFSLRWHKGPVNGLRTSRPEGLEPIICSILSILLIQTQAPHSILEAPYFGMKEAA